MAQQITNAGLTFNYLQPNDCIGDSLGFFNANLTNLITLVNNLSSNLYTVTSNISAAVPASTTVAKAWGVFNGTIASGLINGYQVTSVTKTATGVYNVLLSVTLPNTNYAVVGTGSPNCILTVSNQGTNSFQINTVNTAGTATNYNPASFVVYSS